MCPRAHILPCMPNMVSCVCAEINHISFYLYTYAYVYMHAYMKIQDMRTHLYGSACACVPKPFHIAWTIEQDKQWHKDCFVGSHAAMASLRIMPQCAVWHSFTYTLVQGQARTEDETRRKTSAELLSRFTHVAAAVN